MSIAPTAVMAALLAVPAFAAQQAASDWPCIQRKVPELSAAAVWAGPSMESVGSTWSEDPAIADLVSRVSARRTPVEEAAAAIADYAKGLGADRQAKLTALFAGVFGTLNRERGEIIDGIERYGRKQKTFANDIRQRASALFAMQRDAGADPQKVADMTDGLEWETRVFEDRKASLSFVCEVPTLIEQRFFTLAKAIQDAMGQ